MSSPFQIILCCLACICLWGCDANTPEESLLDQFARSLDEKAPYYREFHGVHKEYGGKKGQGKLAVDINRVEVHEVSGSREMEVSFKNKILVTAWDVKGDTVWTCQAGRGSWSRGIGFFLGGGIELNGVDGMSIVSDSVQWDARDKVMVIPTPVSLTANMRKTEEDSLQFAMIEGTSMTADARFDVYSISGLKGVYYVPTGE